MLNNNWRLANILSAIVVALCSRGAPAIAKPEDYSTGKASDQQAPDLALLNRQAFLYIRSQQWDRAIAEYSKLTAINPKDYFAYMYLGWAYYHLGSFDKAVDEYTRAIQIMPTRFFLYVRRASAYDELGQHDKAKQDRDTAIKLDPVSAPREIAVSAQLRQREGFQNSMNKLTDALRLNSNDTTVLRERAAAYAKANFHQKSFDDYSKLISLTPDKWDLYLLRAEEYWKLGNRKAAFDDVAAALRLHPGDEVLRHRATMYIANGDVKKALADIDEVKVKDFDLFMQRGEIHSKNLWGLSPVRNNQEAIKDFTKALRLKPDSVEAYVNRASVYSEMREPQKAIDDLCIAIKLDPTNISLRERRGVIYVESKDDQSALNDFTKSIELDGNRSTPYIYRAELFKRLHQDSKAIADYSKAIEMKVTDSYLHVLRAELFEKQSEYQKAIADYSKAYELKPSDSGSVKARAIVFERIGQYENAVRDLRTVETLNPQDAKVSEMLAADLEKLQRWHEAIDVCTQLQQRFPNNGKAFYYRSRAYDAINQHKAADIDRCRLLLARRPSELLRQYDLWNQDSRKYVDNPEFWVMSGWHHLDLGENTKAIEDFDRAICLKANDWSAYYLKAEACQRLGQGPMASKNLERAVELGCDPLVGGLEGLR
jgi:tetratricopeptide (TPR) repeat protein